MFKVRLTITHLKVWNPTAFHASFNQQYPYRFKDSR